MACDNMLRIMIFSTLFVALAVPTIYFSAAGSDTFTPSATVTDQAPSIKVASGQVDLQGSAGSTATVYVYFDASDENGYTDLDNTTASVTINKSGESSRSSSSCDPAVQDANTLRYNCSITLYYYDADGTWTIDATVDDMQAQTAQNSSITVDVATLDAVDVLSTSIAFSGAPGSNDNAASPNPQTINNTGNQAYATVNLTGHSFYNETNILNVGNVSLNISNSGGTGQTPENATGLEITGASLAKGAVATEQVYFWLDIPNGQAPGKYASTATWTLQANQ